MHGPILFNIAQNAFRTLGLCARASQAQIDQAARQMRIWPDATDIPPTPWDLPWLGSLSRDKKAIENALSRLNDPQTRIEERLMWFNGTDPAFWNSAQPKKPSARNSSTCRRSLIRSATTMPHWPDCN